MNYDSPGFSALPPQKISKSKRTEEWKRACVNYYSNYRYTNGTTMRSSRFQKLVNYELYNGKVTYRDVEAICAPLGVDSSTLPQRFQHYDILSEPLRLLIGEEAKRPDNHIAISEAPDDINRKTEGLKNKIMAALEQELMGAIDPSTVDPNNPPPTPEEILKYEHYTPSDMIESKANQMLKVLKKRLNTHLLFNQGWKDALIAGEEIYWVGILNGQPAMRRVNPVNLTVILDDDHTFIDDAIAVVEERNLTVSSILDEYGDEITESKQLDKLERYTRGTFGVFNTAGGFEPQYVTDNSNGTKIFAGVTPTNAWNGNNTNNYSIRVTRVEWISMKKVGELTYIDETGVPQKEMVEEGFKEAEFKEIYPDAKIEWFWINEAWEGVKIGQDIYVGIRPKENQRRRMDNPYHCQLGYTGFIYEATNSQSVSLVDRLKSYQYMYDIIHYRLDLAFSKDGGKVFLMDLAQIPEGYGIDIEKWMFYLKETGIGFINSFEEGKKGAATGQLSKFNQFQAIDLSLAQSIQQYINTLEHIKQQVYFVSGVTPQRLGAISSNELVGNVERSVNQSSLITEYLFEAHQEVKRRAYTALIEIAKIAYRDGLTSQYVLDDLGLQILHLEPNEFENSEFSVFVSFANKDLELKSKLDNLVQVALQQEKINLSTIVETLTNDSPRDIVNILRKAEIEFQQRQDAQAKAEQEQQQNALELQSKMHEDQMANEQANRDMQQYIADSGNETKIQVAEINVYSRQQNLDQDADGIPDPIELATLSLKERESQSKMFTEQMKLNHARTIKEKELEQKKKESDAKIAIENKKIEAIKIQNKNQIELANKKHKADKELADKKLQIEKIKAKTAERNKNKK